MADQIRNLNEYEGDLNVNERPVAGQAAACPKVAEKLKALSGP